MRKLQLFLLILTIFSMAAPASAIDIEQAKAFAGQDLHLKGRGLISYQLSGSEHVLVFSNGFSMSIGDNRLSSSKAVVWLKSQTVQFQQRNRIDYEARVYLEGEVAIEKGKTGLAVDLNLSQRAQGQPAVLRFDVSGEIFVTAEKRTVQDPRELALYKRAAAADVSVGPRFVVQQEAMIPGWGEEKTVFGQQPEIESEAEKEAKYVEVEPAEKAVGPEGKSEFIQEAIAAEEQQKKQQKKEPKFSYPVNISPAGEVEPEIEYDEKSNIATIIGRFYLWQKQDEKGGSMELQADNAVIFRSGKGEGEGQLETDDTLDMGPVSGIYVAGNVVMTEGARTIRAEELYYDFEGKRALIINAEMRNFDAKRGIPIYVRAKRLRQISENKFAAENVTLTSSEFYQPQISSTVSKILITDLTGVADEKGEVGDDKYDARMYDVRLKAGKNTIFYWPFMRSNLQTPDIPIKSVRLGHDSRWGTSVETRWYLSRLLGLKEPAGVESTFALDHFGKRGTGVGAQIKYRDEDYYGNVLGYVINDRGKDKLGRHSSRENIEPDDKLRGRFSWKHRQFLPFNWQLTGGIGYASDENFIEGYYRSEYNVGVGQETYLHLKRLEDNWAISLLAKGRINDFKDVLEELPTVEYHLIGQSLFDNRFTLYSDTQVSRLQQKIGAEHRTLSERIDQNVFTFISHRTELDMPIQTETFKMVPYVAGTFGYDDRSGFTRTLVDGSPVGTGTFGEDQVWLGEAGIRIFGKPLWKVYPNVKSRLWDLDQVRHIIEPRLTAALYVENDKTVRQKDTVNIGLFQRLQTKRGPVGRQRTVDWMRFDVDATFVDEPEKAEGSGADRFVWSSPIVPMRVFSVPKIFGGDLIPGLHRFETFGPRRNSISADYIWRVSDMTAVLSDMNYDLQSGVVQQFNVGFSRLLWPNMSYYVGSRYLNRLFLLDEQGSNIVNFALTYVLDPRYTVVFSQEWDFDYGKTIRSDITLIRKYHRIHCAFTYSSDMSLDREAIVFSIWPQGVKELAFGKRRYVGIGGDAGY